jgi:hypothetical protein
VRAAHIKGRCFETANHKREGKEMMKEKIERAKLSTCFLSLILIMVWAFFGPQSAHAQWTNPDASTITTTNNVGIGTTSPSAPLEVKSSTTLPAGSPGFLLQGNSNTERIIIRSANSTSIYASPYFMGQAASGTIASPGAALLDMNLAGFFGGGYNGSAWALRRGGMFINAAENWSTTANGTYMVFETTPLGSTSKAEAMRINPNGLVGIGTTTPDNPLTVKAGTNSGIILKNASLTYSLASMTPRGSYGANLDQGYLAIYDTGVPRVVLDSAGSSYFTGGNVGIGTASPGEKLHLAFSGSETTIKVGTYVRFGNSSGADNPYADVLANSVYNGAYWVADNASYSGMLFRLDALNGRFSFYSSPAGAIQTYTERVSILQSGRVGVGTTNPGYELDVLGQIRSTAGFVFPDGTLQTTAATGGGGGSSQWTGTGSIYYNGGKVGIGTASPESPLSVTDTGYNSIAAQIIQSNTSASNGLLIKTQTESANDASLIVLSKNGEITGLVVRNNGFVGIGKTNPAYKLDVAGDLNASGAITGGTINAKYQDVAEWVPSSQKLSAGTVVILDPEKSNQVIASTESYDTRVAGVISERPGVLLGEGGEGKVKVATTGRVRVRVDATRGAIKIGDLLVASDESGVAMKSEPIMIQGRKIHAPGTIIGKALEPLEKGRGEILVLLSLQ